MEYIPYGRQNINKQDIQAVFEVLKSEYLTQGPVVPLFEKTIAHYCGAKEAVAVNSATSALHIACLALGVGKDDRVWTSPITFVASANCAIYCGAKIDFVDIDPNTYSISIKKLTEKLDVAQKLNELPKIVIPVHMAGQSCDMEAIHKLSQRYDFKIIEDASHAVGGQYQNKPIGSCHYSDITVFSFHPVKIITTGEGGAAVTNNPHLAKQMRLIRNHGITRDIKDMSEVPDGPWYYQQLELGFNYRMTDIQGALGVSQMTRLDEFVAERNKLADRYDLLLQALPVRSQKRQGNSYSSYHLYIIRLNLDEIEMTHKQVFENLRTAEVGVNLHYIPVYRQPYYRRLGFVRNYCPDAERYYAEAISLPIYPGLNKFQQNEIVSILQKTLN
ncbi:UDP-4-amino-4,6-dideoxy-N-acetyl-beta-L-altrosamine transaminase [Thermodesulfobacteriota bacterium]